MRVSEVEDKCAGSTARGEVLLLAVLVVSRGCQ